MLKKIRVNIDSFVTFWTLEILDLLGWTPFSGKIRANILRTLGYKVGKNVLLSSGLRLFSSIDDVIIGDNTFINQNVFFDAPFPVKIGEYCSIGFNTVFTTGKHEIKSDYKSIRPTIPAEPIIVEDFVWIGANSLVLSGVKIGKGSVVAAGSIVTRDVPSNTVVAGSPAKVIKQF